MAGAEKRLALEVTAQQANVLLDALFDKSAETDRYLMSYPKDAPQKTDTCCDAHMARFEQRAVQREALLQRKAAVRGLITAVEALGPEFEGSPSPSADPTTVDVSAVTLVYRDEAGRTHEQPLADITTAGTLVDPEDGDDLELVSAVVATNPARSEPEGEPS